MDVIPLTTEIEFLKMKGEEQDAMITPHELN
jgi:hypothetical protein